MKYPYYGILRNSSKKTVAHEDIKKKKRERKEKRDQNKEIRRKDKRSQIIR